DVDPLRLRLLMLLSLLPQLLQYYCRVDSVSLSSQLAALLQSHPASAPVAAVLTQYAQVKFSTSTAFLSELAPAVSAAFFPRYEMVTFSLLVEWAERGASSAITPSILDMLAHLLRHVQLESSLLRAQGVALCSSLFKHFDGPLWKKPVEITEPFMASLDPSRMEIAHSKRIDVVNRLRDLSSIPSSWSSPDANLATIAASLTAIMTRSDPLNCDSSSDSLPSPRHHKSSKKSKPGKKSKGEKVPRSSSRRHVDEDVVKTPPPRRTRNDK
ncbi:MAG: hypothetical protein Q8P67_12390, partial [archaeon]|nr:hypothetical protein [archaeon]